MRSSKRKTVMKSPKQSVFKSAPVIIILMLLLGLFLTDLYWVLQSTAAKNHQKHQKNEQIDK